MDQPKVILPAPGVHRNVDDATYRAWDAVNQSTLKNGETMLHVYHNERNPKPPTPAMELGTQIDMALTEPAKFAATYVVAPKFDMRKTADKEAAAKWDADNAGKKRLTQQDWDDVQGMAKALREHPAASKLFTAPGDLQLSLLWRDEETGLMCKARLDRLLRSVPFGVDLKSTHDASPWAFAKTVMTMGYHQQAAWYQDGARLCGLSLDRFLFPVVEQSAPYAVAVYDLGAASIELGRIKNREALNAYAAAKKSGKWPGYPATVQPLEVPAWALRDIEATSTFEVIG